MLLRTAVQVSRVVYISYLFSFVVGIFMGTDYLIQGKRAKNRGEWKYMDGSKLEDFYTLWGPQSDPTSSNSKVEFIVLQPRSNYTWTNSDGSESVSGFVCEA